MKDLIYFATFHQSRPTDHDPPLYEWGLNLLHVDSYMSGWCCANELQVLIELPGSDYKIHY